ncbi:uncharacterized protein LOC135375299 [Ornithodoros turicata]|uniref:uncharacterized protein LOC135375299 n=1 Tax=Ornithodoros turicata TaxID=34597 RepID=UPI0031387ACD
MESASDAGDCFSLRQSMSSAGPENVLVLDGLPLEPFVPYQIVSQYGFHYTLVPHKPESVAERVKDKQTQTAIPTSTLGTQTGFHMQSRESQTGMSLPPSSSLLLTSSELATCCPEDSNIESVDVSAGQASMQHIGAPAFEELMPTDMLYMPLSPVHCSTPAREELDTTLGSTCQPDPKDVTVHSSELTEGSETEDDEYEKEHE